MSSIAISLITFMVVFGGALLGIWLRAVLPRTELTEDSRDVVKLGVGLIATMSALVLGLLIASAKSSFDTQNNELTEMASRVVVLDRILAHYGPEAKEARDLLRNSVVQALDLVLAKDLGPSQVGPPSGELLYDKIQGFSPKDDAQRSMQAQALSLREWRSGYWSSGGFETKHCHESVLPRRIANSASKPELRVKA